MKRMTDFPLTRLAIKGWTKLKPRISWSPLTWNLTCGIAVQLAKIGHADMAFAVILAFDCLLRIGELTGLRVDDIGGLDEKGVTDDVGLRLRKTKTGTNKFVKVRKQETKKLLAQFLQQRKQGQKLFDFDPPALRSAFGRVCTSIGLDSSYVPHSLRHGGATELFEQTDDLHLVMVVGRWAVEASARSYIQDARALLLAKEVPVSTARLAKALAADILRALECAVTQRRGGG